jgi:hypothetical protein
MQKAIPRSVANGISYGVLMAAAIWMAFLSWPIAVQIFTLSLILIIPAIVWQAQPSKWAMIGCLLYVASYFISHVWQIAPYLLDPPHAYGFALRLYPFGRLLLVVVYCGSLLYAMIAGVKPDRQAQLVWLVLFIAEGFSLLEYVGCKMLTDPFARTDLPLAQTWAIEGSKYACGRLYGWYTPYIVPIITSLYLLFVLRVGRWKGSGRRPS